MSVMGGAQKTLLKIQVGEIFEKDVIFGVVLSKSWFYLGKTTVWSFCVSCPTVLEFLRLFYHGFGIPASLFRPFFEPRKSHECNGGSAKTTATNAGRQTSLIFPQPRQFGVVKF